LSPAGYRIRELTELEQAEKVRDEVRRLREGEKGLVKSYKQYLKMLEAEIKSGSIRVRDGSEGRRLNCFMSPFRAIAPGFRRSQVHV
jgi:hypothetical protein